MTLRTSVVTISVVVLAACGGGSEDAPSSAPDSVTGIVTDVDSSGLNEVTSFEVKDGDEIYEILIDDSVNYGFPLGHIEEHRKLAEPVRVDLEERGDSLFARTIEDASAG